MIILDWIAGRELSVLMSDGNLEDVIVDPPHESVLRIESVLVGAVQLSLSGTGGQFVKLPNGTSGYLKYSPRLAEGAPAIVQVSGYAEPMKAVPLTSNIRLKGRYCIVTPKKLGVNLSRSITDKRVRNELKSLVEDIIGDRASEVGVIVRTEGAECPAGMSAEIKKLMSRLEKIALAASRKDTDMLDPGPSPHQVALRDWAGYPGIQVIEGQGKFNEIGVLDLLEEFLEPRVGLKGGGSIIIEQTHAFVSVDVNTGSRVSRSSAFETSLVAARALPRELRIRGLGGQIVVDFPPLNTKSRSLVERQISTSFQSDCVSTQLVGWTRLGHFELRRKRERLPLTEVLQQ